jgi:hypothetical protein
MGSMVMQNSQSLSLIKTIQKLQVIEYFLRNQVDFVRGKKDIEVEEVIKFERELLTELTETINFNDYDHMGELELEDLSSISSFMDYIDCPFYQPFLFWNENREIVLYNKVDDRALLIINEFLCTFLDYSDRYNIAYFEYFEVMLYTYIANKHIFCNEKISHVFDKIYSLWHNKRKTYWPLIRYIRSKQNDINNKNIDIELIYNAFTGVLKSHPNSYGFELIKQIHKKRNLQIADNQDTSTNNDNLLEGISLLCSHKRSKCIKFKEFKELTAKFYMGDRKLIEGYFEMGLNTLGHISRDDEKIFVLPPTLNRMHFNKENGVCSYLLSGARTKEFASFLHTIGKDNNIELCIYSQPFSWAPDAIILEGEIDSLRSLTQTVNRKLGDGFLTINQSNQIAASCFISHNFNEPSFKDEGQPGAGYERRRYFCENSFTFTFNEPKDKKIVLIEYSYLRYNTLATNYYYIKNNNSFFQCDDKHTAMLQLFSLRNHDFLIYNNENNQLIIPKYFNFPLTIAKGLTIKSGMLPKDLVIEDKIHINGIKVLINDNQKHNHIFTLHDSLKGIPGFKSYSNISEKDVYLLLKSINQKSIAISENI